MMEQHLTSLLENLALDQLKRSPIGEKLQQAIHIFQTVQNHYAALAEKQDELGMTGIKAMTMLTFAIFTEMSKGKKPSELNAGDWANIAAVISEHAVLKDDQQYSVLIFSLYEKYIRYSVEQISPIIPVQTTEAINGLADELREKAEFLSEGYISEVTYTEDCLWISLEAMIKLLASTAFLSADEESAEFTQALAAYAFEYGRLMLHSRELELVNQFIESQYQMDAELEQRYAMYLEDLQKESQQFCTLIDNAFAPNFRNAFLHSVLLAKASGVKEEEILASTEDIDSFFLD